MSEQVNNDLTKDEKLKTSVLRNFITDQGSIKQLPSQLKKRLIVLEHIAAQIKPDQHYTEKEINDFIKPLHADYATIRRELYIHRFVNRDHEIYHVNDPSQWRDWRTLS
ncbi:hypothetical protein DFQ01_106175 [Paenibacillus cellulosilyticus]|uniref:DUF2087 domain-containing protein n=1 Tax=Paenibacillus cellulosilyticus TaxID=375489 RepID=A0A2V2YUV3_9BACL|nr:DUF2087 domain-containing protein [Paenibacillus cellulosilyticus]PWW04890.1 hypothetical protein DFQ01_106175 [Paenibacillus cellulosilyticus]QKS45996.1 DUF2087 domain-containing protein [Paenibacillus cellulosilyticus]